MTPQFFTTSLLPKPESLLLRGGDRRKILPLRVRVGYFQHPALGHTLIDCGYGGHIGKRQPGEGPLLPLYRMMLQPSALDANPIRTGLARLGLHPKQIDTVVITHFHADHVGGLNEVPQAKVLTSKKAWQAVTHKTQLSLAMEGVFRNLLPADLKSRLRFIDDCAQHEAPLGLGTGWDITGDGAILAVDLPGHLQGHFGLCFDEPARDAPFLYAVDAQWLPQAIIEDRCPGFPARMVHHNARDTDHTVHRIRAFAKRGGDFLLCHGPCLHPFDCDRDV
ncbi:MBL fold metallo-hydrolase [Algirhabdus cladophorae]|uniref:MBL fold metallo-hydrolase n=1 Tax=Algirhabdus cladophorae TaxID=3377108 RepID=UPI003B845D63